MRAKTNNLEISCPDEIRAEFDLPLEDPKGGERLLWHGVKSPKAIPAVLAEPNEAFSEGIWGGGLYFGDRPSKVSAHLYYTRASATLSFL